MKERIVTSASVKGNSLTLVEYSGVYSTFWKIFLNRQEYSKTSNMEVGFEDFGKIFESLVDPAN